MLKKLMGEFGDKISEWTGFVATRVPISRAAGSREVTLDLPGYGQIDSYCCGVVAGIMALKHFKPRASFERFYRRVQPDFETGTSTTRLIRALRQSGVRVKERHDLAFADLCGAIDSGWPVILVVQNPGEDAAHWVVVYGYGKRPNRVLLATNGFPLVTSNRVPLRRFARLWSPHGNGLVCSERRRKSIARPGSRGRSAAIRDT